MTLIAFCLLLFFSGCATRYSTARSTPVNPFLSRLRTVGGVEKPDALTMAYLRSQQILFDGDYSDTIAAVANKERVAPTPDGSFALAELRYLAARREMKHNHALAMELYYDCAAAVSRTLYLNVLAQKFDTPVQLAATDLYNVTTEELLRLARDNNVFKPAKAIRLPLSGRRIPLVIHESVHGWNAHEFEAFEFVSEYDVQGLRTRDVSQGMGTRLIGVRKRGTHPPQIERYYADGLRFPITALLNFQNPTAPEGQQGDAQFDIYDAYRVSHVHQYGGKVELSRDLTTPLARFLSRPDLRFLDTYGLLWPERVENASGLYMIQPYDETKIPVLMVHGIWSSPLTWMDLFNQLQANPEFREKYQFWFYLYPTAIPFWVAAAELREDLGEARRALDPYNQNPGFDQMVMVGHSMGGLITRMQTINSGDRFLRAMQNRCCLTPRQPESEQRRTLLFTANPSITRIVTIASPFRGSSFANNLTRWTARTLISTPAKVLGSVTDLFENRRPGESLGSLLSFTSVDSLSPRSPALHVLDTTPLPPGVNHHNIVGDLDICFLHTDGIVPTKSSLRNDVVSQIVVPATHGNIQRDQRTAQEIERILNEHLRATGRKSIPGQLMEQLPVSTRAERLGRVLIPRLGF